MSSAKMVHWLDYTACGRSFTYSRNNVEPSIEPCGTPDVTGSALDVAPGTVTRYNQSALIFGRNFCNSAFVRYS